MLIQLPETLAKQTKTSQDKQNQSKNEKSNKVSHKIQAKKANK